MTSKIPPVPPVLWGSRTGNCLRAAIGLCEAEIPFTIRPVALTHGEHRSEPFLALNPSGKVPVLTGIEVDGAAALTQSNAILFYADQVRPGRLLPAGGLARARAVERFFYFVTDVIGLNGAAFALQRRREAAGSQILIEGSVEAIVRTERFLEEGPFMGGESFSLADIVAFTIVKASSNHLRWPELPLLHAWLDRIGQRPGVQRGWTVFD